MRPPPPQASPLSFKLKLTQSIALCFVGQQASAIAFSTWTKFRSTTSTRCAASSSSRLSATSTSSVSIVYARACSPGAARALKIGSLIRLSNRQRERERDAVNAAQLFDAELRTSWRRMLMRLCPPPLPQPIVRLWLAQTNNSRRLAGKSVAQLRGLAIE